MLLLTTTKWTVWFLRGIRQQGRRSDYDPSALPATRKGGTVAIAAELRHRELADGILIKGVGAVKEGKAGSVLTFTVRMGEGPKVKWEARKRQRADWKGVGNDGEQDAEKPEKGTG